MVQKTSRGVYYETAYTEEKVKNKKKGNIVGVSLKLGLDNCHLLTAYAFGS